MFSTFDQDNDSYQSSCAVKRRGAWWYVACLNSNLNAIYHGGPHESFADGVNWYHWTGYNYSLRFTEMKIRPADV
jgi:ficolin